MVFTHVAKSFMISSIAAIDSLVGIPAIFVQSVNSLTLGRSQKSFHFSAQLAGSSSMTAQWS